MAILTPNTPTPPYPKEPAPDGATATSSGGSRFATPIEQEWHTQDETPRKSRRPPPILVSKQATGRRQHTANHKHIGRGWCARIGIWYESAITRHHASQNHGPAEVRADDGHTRRSITVPAKTSQQESRWTIEIKGKPQAESKGLTRNKREQ